MSYIFPDGINLKEIIASINTYSTQPTSSIGKGEIAYFLDEDEVYVNKGTASTPAWDNVGSGSSMPVGTLSELDGMAAESGMMRYVTDNPEGYKFQIYEGSMWVSPAARENTGTVSNPLSNDLDANGHYIKDTTGSLHLGSYNGQIVFYKL